MSVDHGLRQIFRARLPHFDWCTVETGSTEGGVPDSNYCYQGVEGWIEHKRADHWRAKIRANQIGWAERRLDHGGRVFVAVRRAKTELWMYHGSRLRDLQTTRLDQVPCLGTWSGSQAKWDWVTIVRILIGPYEGDGVLL